jgi:hypothetical protein
MSINTAPGLVRTGLLVRGPVFAAGFTAWLSRWRALIAVAFPARLSCLRGRSWLVTFRATGLIGVLRPGFSWLGGFRGRWRCRWSAGGRTLL